MTAEYDATGSRVEPDRAPDVFPSLEVISAAERRCPRCGARFSWIESTESIQGGPESVVYETLRRLP